VFMTAAAAGKLLSPFWIHSLRISPQRHRQPESLLAQISDSIAGTVAISRATFDPSFAEHVFEGPVTRRRQPLVWRPLGLQELL
jgi:hypothetical protein